jgi:YbbR domain-containing protein
MSRLNSTEHRLREAWEITVDAWQRSIRTMRNTPSLLLLSGLLGVSLWVFVTEEENPTRVDELPAPILVQAVTVEDGLAVANQLPSVQVVVAAPEERWDDINSGLGSFSAFVDLNGITGREQTVPVRVEIQGIRGARVVEVIPDRVTVNLEELTSVEVPVRVRAVGPLPLGYEQGATSVDPQSVTVTGPESLVSRVNDAVADINVTGLTLGVPQTVTVVPRGAGGSEIRGVTLEPSTARVDVEIRPSTLVRPLRLEVDVRGAPAAGYWVTNVVVSPATIQVEGTLETLQQVDSIELGEVDVTGELSDVTRAFTVELPPGLSNTETQRVTVVVQIAPIEGDFSFALAPTLVGLSSGLTAELDVETIEVTLNGPLPLLSQFSAEDLIVTLDVTGLGVGIHDVPVELTVPEGAVIQELQPETVSVTLISG